LDINSENDCKYRDKNNSIFPFYCLNDDNLSDYCYYDPDEVDDCVYLKLSKIKSRLEQLLRYESVSTWRYGFKFGGDALAYKRWVEMLQEVLDG